MLHRSSQLVVLVVVGRAHQLAHPEVGVVLIKHAHRPHYTEGGGGGARERCCPLSLQSSGGGLLRRFGRLDGQAGGAVGGCAARRLGLLSRLAATPPAATPPASTPPASSPPASSPPAAGRGGADAAKRPRLFLGRLAREIHRGGRLARRRRLGRLEHPLGHVRRPSRGAAHGAHQARGLAAAQHWPPLVTAAAAGWETSHLHPVSASASASAANQLGGGDRGPGTAVGTERARAEPRRPPGRRRIRWRRVQVPRSARPHTREARQRGGRRGARRLGVGRTRLGCGRRLVIVRRRGRLGRIGPDARAGGVRAARRPVECLIRVLHGVTKSGVLEQRVGAPDGEIGLADPADLAVEARVLLRRAVVAPLDQVAPLLVLLRRHQHRLHPLGLLVAAFVAAAAPAIVHGLGDLGDVEARVDADGLAAHRGRVVPGARVRLARPAQRARAVHAQRRAPAATAGSAGSAAPPACAASATHGKAAADLPSARVRPMTPGAGRAVGGHRRGGRPGGRRRRRGERSRGRRRTARSSR